MSAKAALPAAGKKVMQKSSSVPSGGLNATEAFKASVDMPPKFTMRKKISDPSDKEKRPGCQTYNVGNMCRSGNMSTPSWSMGGRSTGIPKPPMIPGPGHYPMPGCLYGAHPTIHQPGRVPKTTTKRTEPSEWEPRDTPSPQDYSVCSFAGEFGRYDQVSAPKFSIRSKIVDPASKEKKPGCQTYDVKNCSRKGPMVSPSWTMAARGSGIPSPPMVPAPGEYPIPGCIYGAHPSIHQPGRVPKTTEERGGPLRSFPENERA